MVRTGEDLDAGDVLVVSGTNVSSGTHMTWFLSLEA